MRVAAVDIGTNTILCLIADVENGEITKIVSDETRTVRLGEGVHKNRNFLDTALSRAEECFAYYSHMISKSAVERVRAVATSAARDVQNGAKLLALGEKYMIPIEIISGSKEAELTFKGMVDGVSATQGVFGIDIGGGSTEVVGYNAKNQIEGTSIDVGCVRLHEVFLKTDPVSEENLIDMDNYVRQQLQAFKRFRPKELIAVAGTPTTFAAIDQKIDFNAERIHGYKLKMSRVEKITKELSRVSLDDRKLVVGLDAGRADVIVVGGVILKAAADIMDIDEVTVSVRGIRYGLALDIALGE